MRVTADTNVLLRALVGDDADQQRVAVETLDSAETVAISIQTLCELVWVLARGYGAARQDIASAIRQLLDTSNIVVDRPAVETGLAILESGGDFADGVIAHDGQWLGGEAFVSFDIQAVKLLARAGVAARLLS